MIPVRKLSDEEIPNSDVFHELEAYIETKLPQDFIDFFQQYSLSESGNYDINVNSETLHFDEFYPITDIIDEVESIKEEDQSVFEKGIIVPFAFNSALDPYALYYKKGHSHPSIIHYSSDEAPEEWFDGDELSDLVIHVRNTFTEFLQAIYPVKI
ncbi:SMI1/KNR4 family protein [Shimazuella kribbensis]|uniref:SMI1/KNR4 family protein n=1 Tax=Shimazuella kribbensis TaxID=139808 RepID=UPI000402EC52|nr:SMI1/KNR4 family protein [Shimazuella kribbensis]